MAVTVLPGRGVGGRWQRGPGTQRPPASSGLSALPRCLRFSSGARHTPPPGRAQPPPRVGEGPHLAAVGTPRKCHSHGHLRAPRRRAGSVPGQRGHGAFRHASGGSEGHGLLGHSPVPPAAATSTLPHAARTSPALQPKVQGSHLAPLFSASSTVSPHIHRLEPCPQGLGVGLCLQMRLNGHSDEALD